MLKCQEFAEICRSFDLTFFTGVPDSTYKSWMSFLEGDHPGFTNVGTVNECEATAISAGYHLATGKFPVLYMQNSGFGKTVNPLTSLCGPDIYRIPVLLMIGWRGEPGKPEAHQHRQIGRIMTDLLDLMEIPYEIISDEAAAVRESVQTAVRHLESESLPFALVVRKGIFEPLYSEPAADAAQMTREGAIRLILEYLDEKDIIVSTTGKTSRELNEVLRERKSPGQNAFYNPGAMGCASSIGLGIALQKPQTRVFVMDGDGALLMQMGALTTIGKQQPKNYRHILFDNHAHESTGGQRTNADAVDFQSLARSCEYNYTTLARNEAELRDRVPDFLESTGPAMLIVQVRIGSRPDLSRPAEPVEIKRQFMNILNPSV